MAGFIVGEPFFTDKVNMSEFLIVIICFILLKLNATVDTLLHALKDPSLPLLEIQVCVCVCACVHMCVVRMCVCMCVCMCICACAHACVGSSGVLRACVFVFVVIVLLTSVHTCSGIFLVVVVSLCNFIPYILIISLIALFHKDLMSSVSGRIPSSVETSIQKCLSKYKSNITSVLCQFPTQQVPVYN